MKGKVAKENFLSGLNCTQSVVLAFKDELGIDGDILKNLSAGFGGGLARLRLTCGAVSGMAMVLSAYFKDKPKSELYSIIQKACGCFEKEVGSLICGELLKGVVTTEGSTPENRTEAYYKKRPCAELCQLAGDIIYNIIKSIDVKL